MSVVCEPVSHYETVSGRNSQSCDHISVTQTVALLYEKLDAHPHTARYYIPYKFPSVYQ